MTHTYLQKAIEQLAPLQTEAAKSKWYEDQVAAAVLFSVIIGLQLLMQNQTEVEFQAEARGVSEGIFGVFGIDKFISEVQELTETDAPLDTPVHVPERLKATSFFQPFLKGALH